MPRPRKVSVLCHDLSINSVGRAQILARALADYYPVEILGPASTGEVWEPLRGDRSVAYRILRSRAPWKAAREIDGDVILASKTRGASFGYGLLAQRLRPRPLLLDIDDWDLAFFRDYPLRVKLLELVRLWNLDSTPYTWLMERLVSRADAVTVSNTFLQRRFGGVLIPHFRDTSAFDPARFDPAAEKARLGLSGPVVLFLGTPRRHKGIYDLIEAVDRLKRSGTTLLIVGADPAARRALPARSFLQVMGPQPFPDIPRFLAAADVVTVFQSSSSSSRGQLPAKVFDAMSMAKPIIGSNVSDLPRVLEDCGLIVEPGDIAGLAAGIEYLLDHPEAAAELGRRARVRCIESYSYEAIGPRLHDVVEGLARSAWVTAAR